MIDRKLKTTPVVNKKQEPSSKHSEQTKKAL